MAGRDRGGRRPALRPKPRSAPWPRKSFFGRRRENCVDHDELDVLLGDMALAAELSDSGWTRQFAVDMCRLGQRRWTPTPKQMSMMRKLSAALAEELGQ